MSIKKIKNKSHEEWLAIRHKYIGGSDAASVVGMSKYRSAYALWAEKTDKIEGFSGNMATRLGTALEQFVANEFYAATGKKVRNDNTTFINSKYPFACANIDRRVEGEKAFLECKTTSSPSILRQTRKGNEFPEAYYCQCVHYLAVTELKKCYLAVVDRSGKSEVAIFEMERDEEEIKALMDAEKFFWENYVLKDVPPPADGEQSTNNAIKQIFKESDDTTADLSDFNNDFERYFEISAMIDVLEKEKDAIVNRIKTTMCDASTGITDGYRVSWKSQVRTSLDTKALQKAYPQIDFSQFQKTTVSRPFKPSRCDD